ncbi:transcription factor bHLH155-like isoform X2 [Aristolochia californica]|uniref:transcription factor bHLH155-like isoform X2 n=1 Tax=Aristolochia californica TaxID=171875 RepID=UPI0035DACFBF
MGSGSLRHLLKSLCYNTQWQYAVFWKFRLQSRMVVGKVAYSGRHLWVLPSDVNSRPSFDYPAEWQPQFAAGIKTILLVPVIPLGVVQLGSLETVVEELALVAQIKDLFNTFPSVSLDFPSSSIGKPFDPQLSFPSPVFQDLSSSPSLPLKVAHSKLWKNGQFILDTDKTMSKGCSTWADTPLMIMDENSNYLLQDKQMYTNHCNMTKGNLPAFVSPSVGSCILQHNATNQLIEESFPISHSWEKGMEQSHHDVMNEYLFSSSCHMLDQPPTNLNDEVVEGKTGNSLLNFCTDSLVPAFHSTCDSYPLNATVPKEDRLSSMNVVSQIGSTVGVHRASNDYLLDAVIAKIYRQSGENACDVSDEAISPNCSSEQLDTSYQTYCRSKVMSNILSSGEVLPCSPSRVMSNILSSGEVLPCSPSGSSSRIVSTLTNVSSQSEGQGNAQGNALEQSNRGTGPHRLGRRKGRIADVCRPRPRDRQMIQDRVKELREIVPNGEKCSIDALLERTIKHMVFLRKITNQAEKLRKCSHPKVHGNENWGGLKSTSNSSLAFELGGQPGICPIIVENLEQPGQMLVEVLCENRGLFLEVADVMRRLNLSILKGIMKKRTNKTWAHFIVEVSKGFQRMDILLPLMQLLQRNQSL